MTVPDTPDSFDKFPSPPSPPLGELPPNMLEGAVPEVPDREAQQVVVLDPRLILPGSVPNRHKAAFDQTLFRRHVKPLSDALKKAPEAVQAEAVRTRQEGQALAPGQVLDRLVAAANEDGVGPSNTDTPDVVIEVDGQCIARLVAGRDGLVQVKMAHALDEPQRAQLAEQLQAFYKRCVAKAPRKAATKEATR